MQIVLDNHVKTRAGKRICLHFCQKLDKAPWESCPKVAKAAKLAKRDLQRCL